MEGVKKMFSFRLARLYCWRQSSLIAMVFSYAETPLPKPYTSHAYHLMLFFGLIFRLWRGSGAGFTINNAGKKIFLEPRIMLLHSMNRKTWI